jgi:hypothetical protein
MRHVTLPLSPRSNSFAGRLIPSSRLCESGGRGGAVSFDGAPVDNGRITFVPSVASSKIGPVSADIVGGKYTLPAGKGPVPGSYRVEIVWNKKTGKQVNTPGDAGVMMDETLQVIPAQFNTNSTLSAEIKSGTNAVNFDLKSR